jgi:hypothetical protein
VRKEVKAQPAAQVLRETKVLLAQLGLKETKAQASQVLREIREVLALRATKARLV